MRNRQCMATESNITFIYKKDYHNAEHMGPCRRLPVLSVTCRLILFYFWTWVCPSLPWIRWYHLGVPPLQPDPRGLESCASLLQPVAAACFSADCAPAATIVALFSPWAFVLPPGFHLRLFSSISEAVLVAGHLIVCVLSRGP